jgi:protease secretion system outer membrane protein
MHLFCYDRHLRQIVAFAALSLMLLPTIAAAQTFQAALAAARQADAAYIFKMADLKSRRLQSKQAGTAFLPGVNVSYSKSDVTSGNSSRGIDLTQPLFSIDKYLQYTLSDPLAAQADAEMRSAENGLSLRVFNAMADIVRARESLRAIQVQIDGLEVQYRRAQRMRELGQGTVTEVSDFEVRLAVAQGNRLNLNTTLDAARRNFTLVTSLTPDIASLNVSAPVTNDQIDEAKLFAIVRALDPAVVAARQSVEVARIESRRFWAKYLPTVSAVAGYGSTNGSSSTGAARVGIVFNAPLGTTPYFEQQSAVIALDRAQESLRAAEDAAVYDAANLFTSLRSLEAEIRVRQRAVQAAQQAVEGNLKSYQGGVKSNIDVVTSFQTLADSEVALVNAKLSSAQASLKLSFIENLTAELAR